MGDATCATIGTVVDGDEVCLLINQMNDYQQYEVFIFDWDGTLFDSMAFKTKNLVDVLNEKTSVDEQSIRRFYQLMSGTPRMKLLEMFYEQQGLGDIKEDDLTWYDRELTQRNSKEAEKAELFPDVIEALGTLKAKGGSIYISSSASDDEIQSLVKYHQLSSLVDAYWGSRADFTKGPAHIKEIQSLTGKPIERMIFVGDDDKDYEQVASTNIAFVRILRHGRKMEISASYPVIYSLMQLIEEKKL